MKKTKREHLKEIPLNERGLKLLSMSSKSQVEVLKELSISEIVEILGFLDPVKASKIIRKLSAHRRSGALKKIEKNVQEKIKLLLKFHHESAGAIMDFNYIETDKDSSVKEISKSIFKHEKQTGKVPTVLITQNGYLMGEVPMRNLITANRKTKAHKLFHKIPHINCNENEEKVLNAFKNHPHGKVVVLNENESVLGIIHTQDILHLIDKQASKSLHEFAGVNKEEDVCDSPLVKVKYRYNWLIINLFTAFLAAAVVGIFEDTISRIVILAAYLPIVAGMGGNAATQTLAVTVRGIALNEIDSKNAATIVKNEVIAGIVNGTITGFIAAIIAILMNQSPLLGLVLAFAMIFNLFIAGFFGTIIPLFMKRIGKDPASSATIFITTATDIFGFFAFLGLATLVL